MHATNISLLTALALTTACAASAPQAADEAPSAQLQAPAATSSGALYFVGRSECELPDCGFYVRALNVEKLSCPDGTTASECLVPVPLLDASALGGVQPDGFGSGRVVVRGTLGLRDLKEDGNPLPTLIADAAWRAVGPIVSSTPHALYLVANNGALGATPVNTKASLPLSGLVLLGLKLDAGQQKQLDAALVGSGVLAVGTPRGDVLGVNRLFLPVGASECWSASDCTNTLYPIRVHTKIDCYCRTCPVPLSTGSARQNEADWQALCAPDPDFTDPAHCWELQCDDLPLACDGGQCNLAGATTSE